MMSETDQAYERGKESAKRDLLAFVKAQDGQFFRTHDVYGANLVRKYLGLEPLTRIDLTQRAVTCTWRTSPVRCTEASTRPASSAPTSPRKSPMRSTHHHQSEEHSMIFRLEFNMDSPPMREDPAGEVHLILARALRNVERMGDEFGMGQGEYVKDSAGTGVGEWAVTEAHEPPPTSWADRQAENVTQSGTVAAESDPR